MNAEDENDFKFGTIDNHSDDQSSVAAPLGQPSSNAADEGDFKIGTIAAPNPTHDAAQPHTPRGAPPSPDEPELSARQSFVGGMHNFKSDFGDFLGGVGHAIVNPRETLKGFGEMGTGLASQVSGAFGAEQDPVEKEKNEKLINAIEDHYKQSYGSLRGFKSEFARHPAGVLADLSVPLSFGSSALGETAGLTGQIAKAAGTVGSYMDPVQLALKAAKLPITGAKIAGKNIPGIGNAVTGLQSISSGASTDALRAAAEAGSSSDAALRESYLGHLKGKANPSEIVDAAEEALDSMKRARGAEYISSKQRALKGNLPDIPFTKINDDFLSNFRENVFHDPRTGFTRIKDPEAADALSKIKSEIEAYQNAGGAAIKIEGVDALKQAIGAIRKQYRPGTVAYQKATAMYKSVRDSIGETYPDYIPWMKNYENASDVIDQVRGTFGVGKQSATDDSILKRLSNMQGSTKKKSLLAELSNHDPKLPYMLAGHELNKWFPGGLRQAGNYIAAPLVYGISPALAAGQFAAASPRLMGAVNYNAGRASRLAQAATKSPLRAPLVAQVNSQTEDRPEQQAGEPSVDLSKPFTGGGMYENQSQPSESEDVIQNAKQKISGNESGGDYTAVGPLVHKNDHAYGKYQVLGSNLKDWTKKYFGQELSPQEFLKNEDAQEKVFEGAFGDLYKKYGNIKDAISAWHSGVPLAQANREGRHDSLGTKTEDYVSRATHADGGRIERASGGSVNKHERLVNRLMTMASSAKKTSDKNTEQLLNVPDESIVKALDVAQQAI